MRSIGPSDAARACIETGARPAPEDRIALLDRFASQSNPSFRRLPRRISIETGKPALGVVNEVDAMAGKCASIEAFNERRKVTSRPIQATGQPRFRPITVLRRFWALSIFPAISPRPHCPSAAAETRSCSTQQLTPKVAEKTWSYGLPQACRPCNQPYPRRPLHRRRSSSPTLHRRDFFTEVSKPAKPSTAPGDQPGKDLARRWAATTADRHTGVELDAAAVMTFNPPISLPDNGAVAPGG